MGKELVRDQEQDEARTDGAAFAPAKSKVCILASNIKGVRDQSEGDRGLSEGRCR